MPSKCRTTSPMVIFAGTSGEHIAAADSRHAVHPALRLEVEHDLLQKSFGDVVAPGQFPNGYRRAAEMVHQREQGA